MIRIAIGLSDASNRDPKDASEEDYKLFYKMTFRDREDPLAWLHFSGDSGAGSAFKAIIYLPSKL